MYWKSIIPLEIILSMDTNHWEGKVKKKKKNDPYQAQIDEIFSIVYIAYSGLITRGKIIFQSFIFVEFTVLHLRQPCECHDLAIESGSKRLP